MIGDIRDPEAVAAACDGVEIVHHNVAQVPIAKDKALFESVNTVGSKVLADQCVRSGVKSLVYTSSSAVFGVPKSNPVTSQTSPEPAEAYGFAKYHAEKIFSQIASEKIGVTTIRPRTILGTGRLGIFQILFEWVYQGKNIPVLGDGQNIYQFVHAEDLAAACIAAADCRGHQTYNIGAKIFGSMRDTLEALVKHAGTASKVVSVNKPLAKIGMDVSSVLGLSPLGPYHSLMYGESMYFDLKDAEQDLGFEPRYSNIDLFIETYDWYVNNRDQILSGAIAGSKHQRRLRQGLLSLIPLLLR
jgi:nucleoside-diphosphate-sugar epimerase